MIESLNRDCLCTSLDPAGLRLALEADPATQGLHALVAERCPHVFSALPVFVSRSNAARMQEVIRAVEEVVALPAYQDAVLAGAPAIAHHDPRVAGVFMGYDFHLAPGGPRLIEINTNAGGAMLNAVLGRAQRACCKEIEALQGGPIAPRDLEDAFLAMFRAEWRAAGRTRPLARVAIVDEEPARQYLYPEFLLFARLFERHGIEAVVVDPAALAFAGVVLRDAGGPIDLVYNRLTDFALASPANAALRAAYLADAAVVTPHPRAHALYADKRNLALLSDAEALRALGVGPQTVETLLDGIARTRVVRPEDAERLWKERRRLFFKPAAGYGGRAAYRGEKVTKRVWDEITAGGYVAQEYVPPSERATGPGVALKLDVRNYVHRGAVQLLAARLYQGQTTNFRTEGGGFAPVLMPGARNLLCAGDLERILHDATQRDQSRALPDRAAAAP
ncbi:MAG TPA: hypothetical protein VG873_15315 [Burkholderiales bacterium]|nr:hypothetical protein [Burkholderiales bacterium]